MTLIIEIKIKDDGEPVCFDVSHQSKELAEDSARRIEAIIKSQNSDKFQSCNLIEINNKDKR